MFSSRSVIAQRIVRQATMQLSKGAPLSTTARLGLKESSSQTDVDYAKHKADSLNKQKKGAGHWKRELSSDSEEAVKADRNSNESIEQLQKRTKQAAEETSKAGTSTRDGL
ncbi:hypothetical protein K4F52_008603 [Lecanicillium sp. MT-2017a]|nr:hypothetical protein K4F52_008603 [Lecanicillium sp. MT-2017a]